MGETGEERGKDGAETRQGLSGAAPSLLSLNIYPRALATLLLM